MQGREDTQLIVQIAIMYYKERLNQKDIAAKLGMTRQTVSKLLRSAEDCGIVEFHIHDPTEAIADMSDLLARKYNLRSAKVVPCRSDDSDFISAILGQYTARQILTRIHEGAREVGIAWGRTMYQMIKALPLSHCENVSIYPLVGASSKTAPYFMINEMVRQAADTLNATPVYAHIPANARSSEDAALFYRTSAYETIATRWAHTDLAVMGIGVRPPHEVRPRESYPGEEYAGVETAVGDFLTHYFDADGNLLPTGNQHILCASITNLQDAGAVLAVAGGREKVGTIHAALKTGVITDIITDQQTCNRLFRMAGRG